MFKYYGYKDRMNQLGSAVLIKEHQDPEIQAEINKGNTVRIIQDY